MRKSTNVRVCVSFLCAKMSRHLDVSHRTSGKCLHTILHPLLLPPSPPLPLLSLLSAALWISSPLVSGEENFKTKYSLRSLSNPFGTKISRGYFRGVEVAFRAKVPSEPFRELLVRRLTQFDRHAHHSL